MKKVLAFLLLLSHINTSMFFPVVEEQDVYDKNGVLQNDINSVVEFVDQEILGHKQDPTNDEDDDQPHFFHMVKGFDYCFSQPEIKMDEKDQQDSNAKSFSFRPENRWKSITLDILVPPPKS